MRQKFLSFYMGFITLLMLAFTFACQKLYREETIIWNGNTLCSILIIPLIIGIIISILSYCFIRHPLSVSLPTFLKKESLTHPYRMFFIIWCVLFLIWVPGFLAYYPGICAYDFQPQMYQIFHVSYNDHHPIIHTLLIEFFWKLGRTLFDSTIIGVAFFTVFQMLFLSAAFSFVSVTLAGFFKSKRLGICMAMLFGLYPLHFYLSLSITKDIPFAAVMLIAFLSLCILLANGSNSIKPRKWDIILFVSAIFAILFRNNARYSFLIVLFFVMVLFVFDKSRRMLLLRIFSNLVLSCIVSILCINLLSSMTNADQGDKKEMFSIPMQQFARVVHYHEGELDDATMDYIKTLIQEEALYNYKPCISDPVKQGFITSEILQAPKTFVFTYFHLLTKYPGEYVNAFLALYAGFLNPLDESSNYINHNGVEVPEGLYYVQTVFYEEDMAKFAIEQHPILPGLHSFMESFANSDLYRKLPIINIFMVPGTFLWFYLYLLGYSVYKHGKRFLLPYALVLSYFLTLFAGPTVQLRYIYPIMLCLPIAFLFTCIPKHKK